MICLLQGIKLIINFIQPRIYRRRYFRCFSLVSYARHTFMEFLFLKCSFSQNVCTLPVCVRALLCCSTQLSFHETARSISLLTWTEADTWVNLISRIEKKMCYLASSKKLWSLINLVPSQILECCLEISALRCICYSTWSSVPLKRTSVGSLIEICSWAPGLIHKNFLVHSFYSLLTAMPKEPK